jgi:hypothetical protein
MNATLTRMTVETVDDDTKPELPTKFDTHKWVSWMKSVENYMWQVKGKNNTPLMYVIRKPRTAESPPFTSEEEERIYQTAHAGPAYMQDRQKVFQLLTQILSGMPAWHGSRVTKVQRMEKRPLKHCANITTDQDKWRKDWHMHTIF